MTVKFDVNGNRSWVNVLANTGPPCGGNAPASSNGNYVGVGSGGLVYVSGSTWLSGGCAGNALGFVIYNASSGAISCIDHYYTGANNQNSAGLVALPSGGAIVTAASQPFFNGHYNIVTIKYNTGCGHDWLQSLDFGTDALPNAMTSDGTGGVYIVGQVPGGLYTLRYDGNGSMLWSATNSFLIAHSSRVAADGSGVYVTGYSPTPAPDGSWAVAAYSTSGVSRWAVIPPGVPALAIGYAPQIAVDSSGSLYATTFDSSVGYLSKYSACAPTIDPDCDGDIDWSNPGAGMPCVQDHAGDTNGDGYSDSDEVTPPGAPTCTGAFPPSGGLGLSGLSSTAIDAACPGRPQGSSAAKTARSDINVDGMVNGLDLGYLARYFTQTWRMTTDFLAEVDLNGDGSINGLDLGIMAGHYAQAVPPC